MSDITVLDYVKEALYLLTGGSIGAIICLTIILIAEV